MENSLSDAPGVTQVYVRSTRKSAIDEIPSVADADSSHGMQREAKNEHISAQRVPVSLKIKQKSPEPLISRRESNII
jgi:hypothetical protein